MTTQEYAEWCDFHRALFAMKAVEDGPMFSAWFTSLAEFALNELKAASLAIAADIATCGKFRTEHLGLLRSRITAKRFERTRAQFDEINRQHARFDCKLCNGTGMVNVPHVKSITDDVWVYPFYTLAVACTCNCGSAWYSAVYDQLVVQCEKNKKPTPRVLTLGEYDQLFPAWQEMMEARKRNKEAESEARWHAQQADRSNPIDFRAIRDRWLCYETSFWQGVS